jgi:transcriptional regulator with XRE-family HTH domain
MATLSEYLSTVGITQSAFAARLGVSRSYMSEIVSGARTPRLELALQIQAASGGAVDLPSLVGSSSSPSAERPSAEAS